MLSVLALLALIAIVGPALGQYGAAQQVYASMESSIRREYNELMQAIARGEGGSGAGSEKRQHTVKVMFHNKAVLFASCTAEAERIRSPQAPRVPAAQNLMLTTCVGEKFAELNKFGNVRSYALIFFPDRIGRCGEASRLRDQEPIVSALSVPRAFGAEALRFRALQRMPDAAGSYRTGGSVKRSVTLRPRRS